MCASHGFSSELHIHSKNHSAYGGINPRNSKAALFLASCPPLLRGHFHLQAESAIEVRDVLVSALEGDGFDRQGAFFE